VPVNVYATGPAASTETTGAAGAAPVAALHRPGEQFAREYGFVM
jgi:hypothetical protein